MDVALDVLGQSAARRSQSQHGNSAPPLRNATNKRALALITRTHEFSSNFKHRYQMYQPNQA